MNKTKPEELLSAGVHLGHRKQKINPASKKYIYKIESGVSIIDLFKTAPQLDEAIEFVKQLGSEGKVIMFVATKKGAKEIVEATCIKYGFPYLTSKWVGGFLTNFAEINKNVTLLNDLRKQKETGEWMQFVKHERTVMEKKMNRISSTYEGVLKLSKAPDALFIIDIKKEKNAVSEAQRLGISTIALVDTNSDPLQVDYPIVGNDDALTSVQFIVDKIAEAYEDGLKKVKVTEDKKEDKKEVKKIDK